MIGRQATTDNDDDKSLIGVDFPMGLEMSMDGTKDGDDNVISNESFWIKG